MAKLRGVRRLASLLRRGRQKDVTVPPAAATRRKRMLYHGLLAISLAAVAMIAAAWFIAGALIAPAPRQVGDPPSELNAVEFTVPSRSGSTIAGWRTRPPSPAGVVVLLHGIRGSRLRMLDRARMLYEAGYAAVLVDLQAHGESPGEAITIGHLERHDARAAVDYARREHPGLPIGVVGVSLGGAAAVLAAPLGVDALVLESVYPNLDDAVYNRVSQRLGPLAAIPSALLIAQLEPRLGISPSELRPLDRVKDVACPVLIISGAADVHTTADETRSMFAAAPAPKELWLLAGAAHEDLCSFAPQHYRSRVLAFFDRHLRDATAENISTGN